MIERKQVEKAVTALLTLIEQKDSGVVDIVDQPGKIEVQLTLKKIPGVKHKNIPLTLPNSLHYDTREVCLFVKDLDKKNREYELTVQHYQDLLHKKNISCISKIIPLKALRTDYSMHSAKRSLAKAYDLYLADEAVFGLLPGQLGKIFFAKKRLVPMKVNLSAKALKSEIEDMVNNTRLVIQGSGSNSCLTVGHSRQGMSKIVDNIVSVVSQLGDKLPGGLNNVKNIYIKSANTKSLPVYFDMGGVENVDLPDIKEDKLTELTDEITTVEDARVKIRADGQVKIVKQRRKKGKQEDGEEEKAQESEELEEESEDGDDSSDNNDEDDKSDDDDNKKVDSDVEMEDSDESENEEEAVVVAKSKIPRKGVIKGNKAVGKNQRVTVEKENNSKQKIELSKKSPKGKRALERKDDGDNVAEMKKIKTVAEKKVKEKVNESVNRKTKKARKV
ncbi:ribosomal L1 domain-containing protein 1-like [Mya arenaria]|uniref:ribosomal L1 domain-containing protein 1-like n=1 Tax=Mya arenaria TaxID=6604 RepID=UPI0022E3558D|nr:ribosomal L1 domain-containing protein 1-like [Mya arenaria]